MLKTHFSPKFALRFGIGINANYNSQELDYKDYYYGYTGTDIPTFNNSVRVTLLTKILYYFNPKSRLNIYVGLGPMATYSFSHSEDFILTATKYTEKQASGAEGSTEFLDAKYSPSAS
jgi:hypothetical protein